MRINFPNMDNLQKLVLKKHFDIMLQSLLKFFLLNKDQSSLLKNVRILTKTEPVNFENCPVSLKVNAIASQAKLTISISCIQRIMNFKSAPSGECFFLCTMAQVNHILARFSLAIFNYPQMHDSPKVV